MMSPPQPQRGGPLRALQRDPRSTFDGAVSPAKKPDRQGRPRRALRCAACGAEITATDQRIQVDGAHQHRFMNPVGFVYDIGCFAEAPGCRTAGQPTAEFTWFRGFAWNFATCKGCLMHLGWMYQSEDATRFFGLIVNRLMEAPDEPEGPEIP